MLTMALFSHINPVTFAFLGPLVGLLTRPVGGWISDKLGSARVTLLVFAGMIAAVLGLLVFVPTSASAGNFQGFLAMFIVLFALTGVGNGSTFRMIPVIFLNERTRAARGRGDRKSVVSVKSASGRVDLGGRRIIKQKT